MYLVHVAMQHILSGAVIMVEVEKKSGIRDGVSSATRTTLSP
jgi:hypothetical protein